MPSSIPAKADRLPLTPRVDFAGWVVRELHIEITLLAKRGAETSRGIDATSLNESEALARIKPLAEGASSLWAMAKHGLFDDPASGRQALEDALKSLGPRYLAMLDELQRFEDEHDLFS